MDQWLKTGVQENKTQSKTSYTTTRKYKCFRYERNINTVTFASSSAWWASVSDSSVRSYRTVGNSSVVTAAVTTAFTWKCNECKDKPIVPCKRKCDKLKHSKANSTSVVRVKMEMCVKHRTMWAAILLAALKAMRVRTSQSALHRGESCVWLVIMDWRSWRKFQKYAVWRRSEGVNCNIECELTKDITSWRGNHREGGCVLGYSAPCRLV